MNRISIFCIIVISVSSFMCNEDGLTVIVPPPYQPPNDIKKNVPLQMGSSWIYFSTTWGDLGEITSSYDTITVIDTMKLSGKKLFRFYKFAPHFSGDIYYESVDSSNYSAYICMGCLKNNTKTLSENKLAWLPLRLLQLPIIMGNEWRLADWDSLWGYDFGRAKIINVDTTITTINGTFEHVITVESSDAINLFQQRWHIVPEIGIIQYKSWHMFGSTTSQLLSWNY